MSSGFDPVRSFLEELFVEMIQLLKRPVGGLEDLLREVSGLDARRVAVKKRRCALLMQRAQLMFRNFPIPTW